ncbi:MAG: adenylate kinase [Nanoarchaeota archaeon]|nr:adenylate kinase [Nanoarchaeota archaeon]
MKLVMMGVQGCGKGTQAELISKKFKILHISTGDLLRDEVASKSELGKEAEGFMNKGLLVPDKVLLGMLKGRLSELDGFILDGYPRNREQAEALSGITELDGAIEIGVSDREAIKRISGRRSCKCGAVYHVFYNPPGRPNICDRCGKPLFQRDDDQEDAVAKRVALYHEKTEPVLKFYEEKGILHKIDGEQAIEEVFGAIEKALPEE